MATGLSRNEQLGFIALIGLILAGLTVQAWRAREPDQIYVAGHGRWEKLVEFEANRPLEPDAAEKIDEILGSGPATSALEAASDVGAPGLDLNQAGAEELERLPGIGPARAQAILALRERLGVFRSDEQLLDVSGIGPKTLEKMQPFLAPLNNSTSDTISVQSHPGIVTSMAHQPQTLLNPQPSRTDTPSQGDQLIDINIADEPTLLAIPGVGPALARRIVEDRAMHGPYTRPEDLVRVRGIGSRSVQKMIPHITAGPVTATRMSTSR